MSQLVQTVIVICIIALAILLFYAAYFMCKKYATSDDSDEIQDYIEPPSSNMFQEKFLFIQMRCYILENIANVKNKPKANITICLLLLLFYDS